MKNFCLLLLFCLAVCPNLRAQNDDEGSTIGLNPIATTTVVNPVFLSNEGLTPSSYVGNGILTDDAGNGDYGSYTANLNASVTAQRELKAYAQVTAAETTGPQDLDFFPSRINGQASAFLGERWIAEAPLAPGSRFPSFVSLQWDGRLQVGVPGAVLGFPSFNEAGVTIDFALYEVPSPNDEPIPVLYYNSNTLTLRADDTAPNGNLFSNEVPLFPNDVDIFDPDDPFNAPVDSFELSVNATPVTGLSAGEFGYDLMITSNGLMPFSAKVGAQYLVNYGLSVHTNVTGAEGYALADFSNTGSVDLITSESGASLTAIPEPGSLLLALTGLCLIATVGIRDRFSKVQKA